MDENLSEAVVLLFVAHGFQLGVKRLHLSLSFHHHVIGDSLAVVTISILRFSVRLDAWLEWLRHLVSSVDVGKFDFITVSIVVIVAASE